MPESHVDQAFPTYVDDTEVRPWIGLLPISWSSDNGSHLFVVSVDEGSGGFSSIGTYLSQVAENWAGVWCPNELCGRSVLYSPFQAMQRCQALQRWALQRCEEPLSAIDSFVLPYTASTSVLIFVSFASRRGRWPDGRRSSPRTAAKVLRAIARPDSVSMPWLPWPNARTVRRES